MTGIFKARIIMETELTYLVLAKDAGHALQRTEEADASEFEEESCTWNAYMIEELTEEEIMADKTHTIKLRPTQAQLYYQAVRKQGEMDQLFMEMTKGEGAITKDELKNLIANRPSIWGRYAAFLDTDVLRDGEHNTKCRSGFEACIGLIRRTDIRQFQCMQCLNVVKEINS